MSIDNFAFYTLVIERGDTHEDHGPWLKPDDAIKIMAEQAVLLPIPTKMTLFKTESIAGWEPTKTITNEPDLGGES